MEIIKYFRKLNFLSQLLLFLIIYFLILLIYDIIFIKENFENSKIHFEDYNNSTLYDNFYSNIYDKIHNDNKKNTQIVEFIKENCNSPNSSTILDIGCGTGEIISKLSEFNIIGLDKSSSMIKICKKKNPDKKFINDDILNNQLFNYNYNFSHILCLNFTIYYFNNRKMFFKNVSELLMPNGILILHLIDKNKFNRMVNVCKLGSFNPCKYTNNRCIKSNIVFDDFEYKCNYTIEKNKGIIDETFYFNNNSIRKNFHTLNLDDNKSILNEARENGFLVDRQIKIKEIDGEYLFILKKNL